MINCIKVENFRSILKCSLELNPLNVIVGANATGKSNLIKAIEFISDCAYTSLKEASDKGGGFSELVPKRLKNFKDTLISFDISLDMEPPKNWIKYNLPKLKVDYHLVLKRGTKNSTNIKEEKLTIFEPLLLSKFLKEEYDILNDFDIADEADSTEDKINNKKLFDLDSLLNSKLIIYRDRKSKIKVSTNFENTEENWRLFSFWLGIDDFFYTKLKEENITIHLLENIVPLLLEDKSSSYSSNSVINKKQELILNRKSPLSGFSIHFKKIVNAFSHFNKYDLFLNELRCEQLVSNSTLVNTEGNNLPSVVKYLSSNKKKKNGWERVITTLSNITPYFVNVENKTLRAGKEYLLFSEIFNGRNIESWESSDGILRALAILLALETHPSGSTIMIEEPEHGLHPWAIKEIINHMREVIRIRKLQIIITTHSPQVLENILPEELFIVERNELDGTSYFKIRDFLPQSDIIMEEIGGLWVKGLLNGVPRF